MCTLVILRRPGHPWPLLIAANRDEMADRPWSPPARHWSDRPEVTAGRDDLADGTWMGINDFGVISAVLNRRNSLGPQPGRRSRGELPLEALDHESAAVAAEALAHLEPDSYRPFNLFIGDSKDAFLLCSRGDGGGIERQAIPTGVSMIAAVGLNDPESVRIRTYLPRFREADAPDPEAGDWTAWRSLLASREHAAGSGPEGAMTIATDGPFGTVCASLAAIPDMSDQEKKPIWLFAAGRPDEAPFNAVPL